MHEYITIILHGCIVPWSTRKVGEDWDVDVKKENDGNNIFMRKLKVEGVDEGFRVEVPWFKGSEECVEESMPNHSKHPFFDYSLVSIC